MHPSLTRRDFFLRSAAGVGILAALAAKSHLPWAWAAPAGRFSGIFAILQTPFNPSDQLDWDDLGREVDFCVRAGAHGLVWPQLAGEFYMMILTSVIAEYEIEKVDDKVMKRMKLALQLPFTDTDAEAAALEKALLG